MSNRKSRKLTPSPQRSGSPPPTRKPAAYSLGDRINRRRVIQILGFSGGGIGLVLLGKALFPPTSLTAKDFTPFNFEVVTVDQKGEITQQETEQSHIFQESIRDVVLDLVPIRGGKFMMGSPESEAERGASEGPQHEVNIEPI